MSYHIYKKYLEVILMIRPDWKDQYLRMIRNRDNLKSIPLEQKKLKPYLVQDSLFDFFTNCYHLADWLKNCGLEDSIEYAINDKNLSICRGIANGTKHLKLNHENKKKRYNSISIEHISSQRKILLFQPHPPDIPAINLLGQFQLTLNQETALLLLMTVNMIYLN